jgi:HAD superfamily hydrolase (TIGR01509 family)
MQSVKAVLFDLDGTLIDTEPAAAAAVAQCFGEWGIQVAPTDASYITGRTWASAFEYLFKKYKLPLSADEASGRIMDRYREALERQLVVVPGAPESVQALAGHCKLALVSGSRRSEILWALEKLGIRQCFQSILGAEDYARSKPAPDGYLKALGQLGVEGSDGLVFEDSSAGIASARAAGLWVVAIRATNHFAQDTSQAHESIQDLTGVDADWIRDFRRRQP